MDRWAQAPRLAGAQAPEKWRPGSEALGISGKGGRPDGNAGDHLLTSLAVSSHNGISAVEPDAADD